MNNTFAVGVLDCLEDIGHDGPVLKFAERPVALERRLEGATRDKLEDDVELLLGLEEVRRSDNVGVAQGEGYVNLPLEVAHLDVGAFCLVDNLDGDVVVGGAVYGMLHDGEGPAAESGSDIVEAFQAPVEGVGESLNPFVEVLQILGIELQEVAVCKPKLDLEARQVDVKRSAGQVIRRRALLVASGEVQTHPL